MEWLLPVLGILLASGAGFWAYRKRTAKRLPPPTGAASESPKEKASPPKPRGLSERLFRTRDALKNKLEKFSGGTTDFDTAEWDAVEEVLLGADVGLETAGSLLERVRNGNKQAPEATLLDLMRNACEKAFVDSATEINQPSEAPLVLMIVGINGVGKTTTIGKLAQSFSAEGKSVLLGAADTFRAGAISQLKVWADRAKAEFVTGREGADPGAVAFDSVSAAKARKKDIVILDTAGRLHTKTDLMDELKKIQKVVKKVIPEAPHETWLVIDGTLGQNSIRQAAEFNKTLSLSGVIVTKLDGTAKGGAILSVALELGLPVRYIGVGEGQEDLVPFEPKKFVDAILG